jgi:hypothetical protein
VAPAAAATQAVLVWMAVSCAVGRRKWDAHITREALKTGAAPKAPEAAVPGPERRPDDAGRRAQAVRSAQEAPGPRMAQRGTMGPPGPRVAKRVGGDGAARGATGGAGAVQGAAGGGGATRGTTGGAGAAKGTAGDVGATGNSGATRGAAGTTGNGAGTSGKHAGGGPIECSDKGG